MNDPTLSFKGLMQYDPVSGWAELKPNEAHSEPNLVSPPEPTPPTASADPATAANAKEATPRDVTRDDPLLAELFDQLNNPQTDDIATHWKVIAQRVNVLSQGMTHQRELRAQLNKLEPELDDLRRVILNDLNTVQRVADHQLVQAKLRAEVSHLAHQRLAAHLRKEQEERF